MASRTTARFPGYRMRTWLRGWLPAPLAFRIPKGTRGCGRHAWYTADAQFDHCYHCEVGVRSHVPVPFDLAAPVDRALVDAAEQGDAVALRVLIRRLDEDRSVTASHLAGEVALLERLQGHHHGDPLAATLADAISRRDAALQQLR